GSARSRSLMARTSPACRRRRRRWIRRTTSTGPRSRSASTACLSSRTTTSRTSSRPRTARTSSACPTSGAADVLAAHQTSSRVHLRAIKLRGFKSFPDPVEVRLEPGVAVVVGPNGSGKSNISDALLWAAGSLAPSELRAEKPDDVLFAGGKDRSPADYCEVELLFDNEDGALAELPFAEVSFMRRLHRGGEGPALVTRPAA